MNTITLTADESTFLNFLTDHGVWSDDEVWSDELALDWSGKAFDVLCKQLEVKGVVVSERSGNDYSVCGSAYKVVLTEAGAAYRGR